MTLREIPGPLGRLEALVDEPAAVRGISRDGLVEGGITDGPKAAVVLGHPHPQYGQPKLPTKKKSSSQSL